MIVLHVMLETLLWPICVAMMLMFSHVFRFVSVLGTAMKLQSLTHCFPAQGQKCVFHFLAYNSIKKHDPLCMNNLGVCYAMGYGVGQCPRRAFLWYKQAAQRLCTQSMHSLGGCYYNGLGTNVNYEAAFNAFLQAVRYGSVKSACFLGLMYSRGEFVTKSERRAYLWYRYGALRGDCNAQYDYSICLRLGEGCNSAKAEADKWLAIAAENGSGEAKAAIDRIPEIAATGTVASRRSQTAMAL